MSQLTYMLCDMSCKIQTLHTYKLLSHSHFIWLFLTKIVAWQPIRRHRAMVPKLLQKLAPLADARLKDACKLLANSCTSASRRTMCYFTRPGNQHCTVNLLFRNTPRWISQASSLACWGRERWELGKSKATQEHSGARLLLWQHTDEHWWWTSCCQRRFPCGDATTVCQFEKLLLL